MVIYDTHLNVKLMVKGPWWAYGGQPFSGTGCPVPDIDFNYFIHLYQMLETINASMQWCSSQGCFCPSSFFETTGINWISCRSFSCFVTDCRCGNWGCGYLVCKSDRMENIYFLIMYKMYQQYMLICWYILPPRNYSLYYFYFHISNSFQVE